MGPAYRRPKSVVSCAKTDGSDALNFNSVSPGVHASEAATTWDVDSPSQSMPTPPTEYQQMEIPSAITVGSAPAPLVLGMDHTAALYQTCTWLSAMIADGDRSLGDMTSAYFRASSQVENVRSRLLVTKARLQALHASSV